MSMFRNVEHTRARGGDVIALKGRTLKVMDLSERGTFDTTSGAPVGRYYQAWVDGYQNDGQSHNEAVWNALVTARKEQHKMTYAGHKLR